MVGSVPSKIHVVEDDLISCELIQRVLNSAEMEAHGLTDSVASRGTPQEREIRRCFPRCARAVTRWHRTSPADTQLGLQPVDITYPRLKAEFSTWR